MEKSLLENLVLNLDRVWFNVKGECSLTTHMTRKDKIVIPITLRRKMKLLNLGNLENCNANKFQCA